MLDSRSAPATFRDVPTAFLRDCFTVDFATGALTWRKRPRQHFPSDQRWKWWNAKFAGTPAGTLNDEGCFVIAATIGGRRRSLRRRCIVWAMAHDAWPREELDQIDGARTNDRLVNLREATRAESRQKAGPRRNNTSGYRGVTWHRNSRRWRAAIAVDRRSRHLGLFTTPEVAFCAYLAAKARYHPFQPIPRNMNEREAAAAQGATVGAPTHGR